jgi:hypothetical protein
MVSQESVLGRVGTGTASDANANADDPDKLVDVVPMLAMYAKEPINMNMKTNTDMMCSLPLYDPPKWGWSALGGVVDLLPPHEVRAMVMALRRNACSADPYLKIPKSCCRCSKFNVFRLRRCRFSPAPLLLPCFFHFKF